MSKPELVYFNIGGRGLPIRLTFACGEVDFTDTRLSFEEFRKQKQEGSLPFGQVPLLKLGGKTYAQSYAIMKYAGTKAGLYPNDPLEAMEVDQVVLTLEDLVTPINITFYPQRYGFPEFKDEKEKLAVRKTQNSEILPPKLAQIEAHLSKNKSGFAVGSKLTIADIMIYTTLATLKSGRLDGISTSITSKYPTLEAIYAKVHAIPAVEKWLKVEAASKK
eukprot:CAMPEP_0184489828 /NCGR_PEP_ID=MMETSP0113_2-20130426/16471_1 /TAXON_ID=91329 /ORGANISM="Norrisiella sphaerica, Strain BC52" /LENGTH=218 /DNA_ID=CAMNT_0026873467 /DNA_START=1 /DNA_END=657 /DNA_ORIENTATION=+